jgi:hypothetical protein
VAAKADPSFAKVNGIAFGPGPVFPVVVGATPEEIPFPTAWPEGVFAQKIQWMSSPAYKGGVTVSGHRLDGPGQALFGHGVPPDEVSLSWNVPGLNGFFEPGAAGVRSPGCYEWTILGDDFTETIIFRASTGPQSG